LGPEAKSIEEEQGEDDGENEGTAENEESS
jgi:hypothetical protein